MQACSLSIVIVQLYWTFQVFGAASFFLQFSTSHHNISHLFNYHLLFKDKYCVYYLCIPHQGTHLGNPRWCSSLNGGENLPLPAGSRLRSLAASSGACIREDKVLLSLRCRMMYVCVGGCVMEGEWWMSPAIAARHLKDKDWGYQGQPTSVQIQSLLPKFTRSLGQNASFF